MEEKNKKKGYSLILLAWVLNISVFWFLAPYLDKNRIFGFMTNFVWYVIVVFVGIADILICASIEEYEGYINKNILFATVIFIILTFFGGNLLDRYI